MHKKVETFSKYTFRQFLSTMGFDNEMKLKSKLPPFSLIHIWCQRAFCLQLHTRLHSSKFRYTWTVGLGTLGRFRFHIWDRVLCQLTGNYHRYCEKFSRIHDFSLARLIRRLATLADMGMYEFGSNNCHSSEKYANFIHRHRAIAYRHTDQNNSSLCVYFVIQIPPFIDWTCAGEGCEATAEITEFANWSSVEWCGSHHRAVTCWIDVQSFCVWWCGQNVYGTWKGNIYANFAMSATPACEDILNLSKVVGNKNSNLPAIQ